ncbi:siderophore-interacting protein [Rhodanobacter sp. DHG33]|uniref:siderophore-interacting protein n=1 Tax=Rhodanobacter sp. DHG33 TaxID=2775921 RepID=UPI00177CFBA7|nr:siderophore-interacting protein [Rhodanobacter sp. DHG33]MBD8900068.1 siderophore-interacting protein [Rhodanobacter sp. DHG33]
MERHVHQRLRHDVVLRRLDVLRVERITPHMQRVTLGGAELRGFRSAAPDDHVKLFFPNRDGELVLPRLGPNGPEFPAGREPSPMRDYTPRHHDTARGELVVDFVLHGDGPASCWAEQAAPGQCIGAGGPRGSHVIASDFDRYVLIGDETALPAIGRWLDEMPAGMNATVLVEIPGAADRQVLFSRANVETHWFERDGTQGETLEHALHGLPAIEGDCFWWIATESSRARGMRQWLEQRGVPKDWIKATGYWKADPNED